MNIVGCLKYSIVTNFILNRSITFSRFLNQNDNVNLNIENSTEKTTNSLIESNDLEFKKVIVIKENFLSPEEENYLLSEIEPYMKRLRYETDHFDDAIHNFRETERLQWKPENKKILERVKQFAFDSFKTNNDNDYQSDLLAHVHILDLHKDGHIKPHVDAVRFCGNIIAGLSLLSDSVMRFKNVKNESFSADVLLKRRSLYIIKDYARYDFTHEILKNSESYFRGKHIIKDRRLSVICRNKPNPNIKETT